MAWSTNGRSPTGHSALGRREVSGASRVPAPAASTTPARLSPMRLTQWINHSLPQTLQIAVFLFYIDAAFSVLYGTVFSPVGFLVGAGSVLAGLGIANEHKWGYLLGLFVAILGLLPFVLYGAANGFAQLFDFQNLIALIFPVALFAALVHPQSRAHQRIWFS